MAENAQRAQQMDNLRKLTLRQLEVLILTSGGKTADQIAPILKISVGTVSGARSTINQQLASNTYELETYYPLMGDFLDELQAQLIPLPTPIIPRSTQPFRWLADQSELAHTALLIVIPLALLALLGTLTAAANRPPIVDRQEVPVTVVVPGATPPPVIVAGPTPPPVVVEHTVIVERTVTVLVPVTLTPRPAAGTTSASVASTPIPTPIPSTASTPTAAPASTPNAASHQVLYQADWSQGPDKWPVSSGQWKYSNGHLLADGTGNDPISAPNPLSVSDYAVEATIRNLPGGSSANFGLMARSPTTAANPNTQSGYLAGVFCQCPLQATIFRGAQYGFTARLDGVNFDPGRIAHTYRLELIGYDLSLYVDGTLRTTTQDGRTLSGGTAGLFSWGAQIEVSTFKITALP